LRTASGSRTSSSSVLSSGGRIEPLKSSEELLVTIERSA
jgi:hypothetical protein